MTRKAVIGELRELKHMFQRHYGKYPTCLEEAIDYIYQTPQWTPVSERLPSDSGNYLVTVANFRLGHIGERTVTTADFYAKGKKWNSVVGVIAWMPLPEPYKGGDAE